MRVSSYEHDGVTYQIDLHEASGSFSTVVEGEITKADTLIKLKEKIARRQRAKTVRLALPATLARAPRRYEDAALQLVDVVVTGIHARQRDVLYRTEKEKKAGQVEYADKLLRRLTPAQQAEYLALQEAARASKKAFETFQSKHEYPTEEIKRAIRQAQTAAGIDPDAGDD